MNNHQSKTTFLVLVAVTALFIASTLLVRTTEVAASVEEVAKEKIRGPRKD